MLRLEIALRVRRVCQECAQPHHVLQAKRCAPGYAATWQTDKANCGSCDTVCVMGHTCLEGICTGLGICGQPGTSPTQEICWWTPLVDKRLAMELVDESLDVLEGYEYDRRYDFDGYEQVR